MLKWVAHIQDALAKKQNALAVVTDPAESELGQWLRAGKAGVLYKSSGNEFKAQWDQLLNRHTELMETAATIQDSLVGFDNLKKAFCR